MEAEQQINADGAEKAANAVPDEVAVTAKVCTSAISIGTAQLHFILFVCKAAAWLAWSLTPLRSPLLARHLGWHRPGSTTLALALCCLIYVQLTLTLCYLHSALALQYSIVYYGSLHVCSATYSLVPSSAHCISCLFPTTPLAYFFVALLHICARTHS
jgi:hypothetical protein